MTGDQDYGTGVLQGSTGEYKIVINPTPARVPHCCPVCSGTGKVSRPPWLAGDQPYYPSSPTSPPSYPCSACDGTGIVWGG